MILYGMDYRKNNLCWLWSFFIRSYDAVAVFHNGYKGSSDIYETLNMGPVLFTRHFLQNKI